MERPEMITYLEVSCLSIFILLMQSFSYSLVLANLDFTFKLYIIHSLGFFLLKPPVFY